MTNDGMILTVTQTEATIKNHTGVALILVAEDSYDEILCYSFKDERQMENLIEELQTALKRREKKE